MLLLITESKEVREMQGDMSPPSDSTVRRDAVEIEPDTWTKLFYRWMATQDLDAMWRNNKEEGFDRGFEMGFMLRGYRKTIDVARKMIAWNEPLDKIMDISGLPLDEINKLMAEKQHS
ncbi:MAG: hypothetical protein LBK46_02755 [Oscillospiraceae bacterium]|jgi:hypothetical protein|nr:hypothetical protein [Oscillospiraceae bacterium]